MTPPGDELSSHAAQMKMTELRPAMTGGSDLMFCMFLGGGKGDMAGGCCLVYDGMMHGGKDPSCPQFRAGFF